MSKFKIGSRVRATTDYPENQYKRVSVGDLGTVMGYTGGLVVVEFDSLGDSEEIFDYRIELVEEAKPTFDLKTNPWYVRINSPEEFDLVNSWLKEQGITARFGEAYHPNADCLSTSNVFGKYIRDTVRSAVACSHKEIKLTFKTAIDSVEYPEYETETQKQLKELEQTIKKAQEQIKILQQNA